MTDQRFIIEMGQGADLHGRDYTKAATRAVENALRRSSLVILGLPGLDRSALRVKVTVGVQDPGTVDAATIAALLPVGRPEVVVAHGGLDVTHPDTGEVIVLASAAVEAFLPPQSDRWRAIEGKGPSA
ncbi:MAG: Lin0512 family protein [Paracoccaceae bacterium]